MGKIWVPPERLMEISKQFAQAREIGVQICSHLTQQIQFLESGWEGTTRQQFYQNFQLARQQMDHFTAAVGSQLCGRFISLIEDGPIQSRSQKSVPS